MSQQPESYRKSKPFMVVKVAPLEQKHLALEDPMIGVSAKGFSIKLEPEPTPPDTVVTQVTDIGSASKHEFVLHIANFGNKPVTATVIGFKQ